MQAISHLDDTSFANAIVASAKQYRDVINDLGFGFPVFTMISLTGTDGVVMRYRDTVGTSGYYQSVPFRGGVASFPEVIIDGPSSDIPQAMKFTLDIVWNAFGLQKCIMYDGQGKWIGVA